MEDTKDFYGAMFPKEISEKCYTDIIDLIKVIFDRELSLAAEILHKNSREKVISVLVQGLILKYENFLLKNLDTLIEEEKTKLLKGLYMVFSFEDRSLQVFYKKLIEHMNNTLDSIYQKCLNKTSDKTFNN